MDLEQLAPLDVLPGGSSNLWDDLKLADTDEDWSVSEASSDTDAFHLDSVLDFGAEDSFDAHCKAVGLGHLDLLSDAAPGGLEGLAPFGNDMLSPLEDLTLPQQPPQQTQQTQQQPRCQPQQNQHLQASASGCAQPGREYLQHSSHSAAQRWMKQEQQQQQQQTLGMRPSPVVIKSEPPAAGHNTPVACGEPGFGARNMSAGVSQKKRKLKELGLSMRVAKRSVKAQPCKPVDKRRGVGAPAKAGKRCEYCLERFEHSEQLQEHRQQHMVGDGHYRCTFADCDKDYATGEGLRLHVRNVHLMAKNWKCLASDCSRSFVRQSDLRMHIIRMHSNIRPFPCPVSECAKSFACHSELRRHVNSCHKLTCPKLERPKAARLNYVDPAFIQGLMMKTEC